jgi:hypothetical protein
MMWMLFFLPAVMFFAIYAIHQYRLIRSIRKHQEAAFYNCFEED